jgi:hypothetical protein
MALPKFSGVYRSPGGAYENPQTVLDKSGFYQAKTMAEAGARIAESINAVTKRENEALKQQRKWIEEDWNFQQKGTEELMLQLQDAGINNKSFYDLGYNIISQRSKVNGLIKRSQTNKERAYYQGLYGDLTNKLVQYNGLVTKIKDAGETYNDDVVKDGNKAGQQGGVALVGDSYNETYNLGMPALMGTTRGAGAEWYEDENGQFRVKLKSNQIKGKNEKTGQMMSVFNPIVGNYMQQTSDHIDVNAIEFLDYDPQRVPNLNDEIFEIYESASVLKNGQLRDEFLSVKEDGTPDIFTKTNDENTMEFVLQNVDNSRINSLTKSSLESLRKSYTDDPKKARIVYHNIFGKPMDEQKFNSAFDEYTNALVLKSLSPKLTQTNKIKAEQPEKPTAEMRNKAVQEARKKERFKEIKDLPFNKKTISDYFVGKDFGGKRILEVKEIVQEIKNGVPNKILSIWVDDRDDKVLEKINITNDSQINNLLDQLSDPGKIPNDLPIFN